jgi:hypothetical protein
MSVTPEEDIYLICTLAQMLAQELATVEGEDLNTITDRIDALRHARQSIEACGHQCPEAVKDMIEIFEREVRQ